MITTYQQTGDKSYFHADVIIDGVRINNVGVRLKGNASLRTALGRGRGGAFWARGRPGEGDVQQGDQQMQREPGRMPAPPDVGGAGRDPDNAPAPQPPGNRSFGRMPFGQSDGSVKIPFMIKFDEFVSGQTYQGYALLSIRTYGVSYDAAMLQEPLTNSVFRALGLPVAQTAYAGVQLNDNPEQLYVISEVIDDTYVGRHFPRTDGVLFKADLGADLRYRGEDPSAYATNYTQQTRINDADMAPLISFMRFLAESDDAAFQRELPNYLDVDAFASYLAINNLLVNIDSMAGMNNNYYLYYDEATERLTLLMWDGNESLGKLGGGTQAATFGLYYESRQTMRRPGGGENTLVKRFLADLAFRALYEEKLQQVYEVAFATGALARQAEYYAEQVRQDDQDRHLVMLADYEQALTRVLSFIARRADYLASTPLLGREPALSR